MPRGGKRSGAGRPVSDRSVPVTVRLSQRSAEFLKSQPNQSEFVEELIQMAAVCSKCGTNIKHVFKIKDLDFGSECIQKIDQGELDKILGYHCLDGLKQAVLKEGRKRQVSFPDSIPPIGCKAKCGASALNYEVIGYSRDGVKVSAIFKGRKIVSTVKWCELLGESLWDFAPLTEEQHSKFHQD